jgi:DAK2 domain fusion protein YloV
MSALDHLSADDLRAAVHHYRDALAAHRDVINRLNVYPVPDGDTGTNMALTLDSVVAGVDDLDAGAGFAAVCAAISHGSLMGARGNSGVILSQILRGLCGELRALEPQAGVRPDTLARGLASAADAAYGAVMRPVEGTILTVARAAADAAGARVAAGGALVDVLAAAHSAATEAVARTPELLPVLAEAGVVDAGGTGLVLLFDALLHVVDGRPLPEPEGDGGARVDPAFLERMQQAHAGGSDHDVSGLRYEVMYFLEAPDRTIGAFKDVWAGIGDSIVVVGGDGLWNCHIHTDDIGASIEAAIQIGRPRDIRVTDLHEQVEEERWVREAEPGPETPERAREPVETAVVAVSTGDGIRRIFHSLGVQGFVTGGQTMNPSTADLLAAVEAAPADHVVILPNNKNIIPVADQVDAMTAKTVHVVPTRGIAEGFASLLAYDPEATGRDNAKHMANAAESVVAGEVTRAVRDSSCELGPIAAGDWLGLGRDGIRSVAPDVAEASAGLLAALVHDEHELVTIIEGEGASDAVTRHLVVWLERHRPDVGTEVHHGGQPLYPYLFGIE